MSYHREPHIPGGAPLCPAKRQDDLTDELCERFLKRLRIDGGDGISDVQIRGARCFSADTSAASDSTRDSDQSSATAAASYDQVNGFLHLLHNERCCRQSGGCGPMAYELPAEEQEASRAMEETQENGLSPDRGGPSRPARRSGGNKKSTLTNLYTASGEMLTSFALSEVLLCSHASGGRCLNCSGRRVQNVPLSVYSQFCAACAAGSSSSPAAPTITMDDDGDDERMTRVPPGAALMRSAPQGSPAGELTLAASAALIACLAPEPGERLLHLGSGVGRLLLAWSLMLPGNEACGVESSAVAHNSAQRAVDRLPEIVRRRIFLVNGGFRDAMAQWRMASVIVVNAAGLADPEMDRMVEGLDCMAPGSRVVTLWRPICRDPKRAPVGFEMAREVAYRTIDDGGRAAGNCTTFVYKRKGVV
eukprot:TRINITY_DN91750_c0_g1_i1.p1 TRINITY_DN91750_c0_g1~~TRINITY_DN91750_c0_g1_i1.p1  ORF type:complete len:419 (-),score=72.21 TRINITY_DN91750_c0_g1_i1:164-1420(-)